MANEKKTERSWNGAYMGYAVLGENETGKSVLLKCLMGISELDGGEVRILDNAEGFVGSTSSINSSNINGSNNISANSICNISGGGCNGTVTHADRPNIGFAPQNFDIPGTMHIYQLLNFVSTVNGLLKDQTIRRYKAMAIMTGLPESDHLVSRLGYCQKKALSLLLAIIHEPELIILDDITSGVDTTTMKNIWTLLSWINQTTECTIIVSASNNFCFMETVITHAGILMNGRIVKEDTANNLLEKYEASSIGDLLIEVIFTEDHQMRDPSVRTGRLPSIKSPIIHNEHTSLQQLNSIYTTQNEAQRKRESLLKWFVVLQALIMKNIWTLIGINSISLFVCAYAVLLPLAVHMAFTANSQRAVRIAVHSQETSVTYNTSDELGDCDKYRPAETMSYTFTRQYLAKSFQLMYISNENNTTSRSAEIEYECLLFFNRNYTAALQRRIKRKIEHDTDFDNSRIEITMSMTDGQKTEHVKDKLLRHYNKFLSNYARDVSTDINYKYIKYNYTLAHDDYAEYSIYRRYVNSGLMIVLTFFFHASIAVRLMQVGGDYCYYGPWKWHLSRIAVQVPLAVVWNAFSVAYIHALYDISPHRYYVFLCLFLESVCGIHLGKDIEFEIRCVLLRDELESRFKLSI
ncbi:AAA+ ATPase domain,P-loop containing nucleoside triphosphate hydrolase,ABC transporter-like [Cinara cedri]|uniref:AAA+ ATPase domain,P-loop containing nucleoside triphosphate hydrolase,ABC transporter-like n=1 Tax=Cinara cedri TaxID=506608 RepID=A0A5E4M4P1_9HEMI|nr:AAA+ ATPase domain,P-loop containing nucleoside triphosphate hydrolase,ABC transporter-like [Cinara cedri]